MRHRPAGQAYIDLVGGGGGWCVRRHFAPADVTVSRA